MYTKSLNGKWLFKCSEDSDSVFLPVTVPGTVLSGLLDNDKIEDPFYGTNEYATRELFRKNYIFERNFVISEKDLEEEKIDLVCFGLDTIADIFINGIKAGYADNMHRTWRYPVKALLFEGENRLSIIFHSPIKYMESHIPGENKEIHYIPSGCMAGNQYIRKAHCMFGWDWGAQLVDAGIWRDICLEMYSDARLLDVLFTQKHITRNEDSHYASGVNLIDVELSIKADIDVYVPGKYKLKAEIFEPCVRKERACSCGLREIDDTELSLISFGFSKVDFAHTGTESINIKLFVDDAKLWWPNNLGEQPLYKVVVSLICIQENDEDILLEKQEYKLGLRTFEVSTEKDQWGHEFAFKVNGVKFFSMGADYIPEDSIYTRISKERIEYLVKSSVRANYNTLRVWGGGYYPSDAFYDLCDEYGLVVWQDLMYACNVYELTEGFLENISAEAEDNCKRLRHHASLGLWCGNNEMESAWNHWYGFCDHSTSLKSDYFKMFEMILPDIIKKNDPGRFWWPSSPSSGGWLDNPDDDNRGDKHYWDVWHGQRPFTEYRNFYFRFCSEFGFQSFPSVKTIKTFAASEDFNIFSEVMESHQKNGYANGKILYYLSENFLYPKDFESLLYVTQILQGLAIKFGVEHWRRNRGRCMGSLYWQINDSWPVASWSSIDYFGRWKALHYMASHFYSPFTISLMEKEKYVELWLENETFEDYHAEAIIKVRKMDFTVIDEVIVSGDSSSFCSNRLFKKDYSSIIAGRENEVFLESTVTYYGKKKETIREIVTFVPWKYMKLPKADITYDVCDEENRYSIKLKSDAFAPFVALDFCDADGIFSDNFFHITDEDGVTVYIDKLDFCSGSVNSLQDFYDKLIVRSLRDSY